MAQAASLVITIKNEESGIIDLLNSIYSQSLIPNELVVIDGGSTDQTVFKIIDWHQKKKIENKKIWDFNLVLAKGKNRSQGRNLGVKSSQNEIVALTDAGCKLRKTWLELITKPIRENRADYVCGAYTISPNAQPIGYCAGVLTWRSPLSEDDKTFLPSARSMAIKKSEFIRTKGFPKNLNTAEDLVWGVRLRQNKKLVGSCVPEAIVEWTPPGQINKILKTFYSYAYGDGLAGSVSPHFNANLAKTIALLAVLIMMFFNLKFVFIFALFPVLWIRQWFLRFNLLRNPQEKFILALIIPIISIATIIGFVHGLISSNVRK